MALIDLKPTPGIARRNAIRIALSRQEDARWAEDAVAVEEPLEIRVDGERVATTMRTPGDDARLAVRRPRSAEANPAGDGPYVVVHPGASVPARAWAPERNAALVAALADAGRRVVVTGGPGERDLTAAVAGPPRPEVSDLGGHTDLAGLAEVLAGAECVVVGNTGPAHLAAAVGTPVVSLYAPTVPAVRWRPWGVPHVLLGDQEIPCAGCRAKECPFPDHPCLGDVAVDEVVAAVDALVGDREAVPA
jgi:ADP-heptose:LPS heptosyltransferase